MEQDCLLIQEHREKRHPHFLNENKLEENAVSSGVIWNDHLGFGAQEVMSSAPDRIAGSRYFV